MIYPSRIYCFIKEVNSDTRGEKFLVTLPSWNESEKKIKIFQLGEDKGLSSKFIHAYILPGVWRTCVINADRRSISNLPQIFSSAGSPIREAVSSIAHLKTQWDIDTTASLQLACTRVCWLVMGCRLKGYWLLRHSLNVPTQPSTPLGRLCK